MDYKIVYFAFVSANFGGVEQKIISQFDALKALGAEIHLFLVSSYTPNECLALEIGKRSGVNILTNSPEKIKNPWTRRKEKFDLLSSVLLHFNPKSTIIYFRYPLADMLFLRFLYKNKIFIFVTEHQDIENTFGKGKFSGVFLSKILELFFGKLVRKRITGFVSVTTEIEAFEKSLIKGNGHFFITIGNGIDINRYQLRTPDKDSQPNEIRILFVGTGYRHHGLDRLINSIYSYSENRNNSYEIKVKIAGDSIEMNESKNLVKELKLSSTVSFLGDLENENLNKYFNWAHVGMGSMGLHRIGLNKSSTLKNREYFARGLAFFWSSTDDDFPANYPYILQLKPDDSSFDISKLISFAERISHEENHPQKMRLFAIEHLDWIIKMKTLVSFFDNIVQNTNR